MAEINQLLQRLMNEKGLTNEKASTLLGRVVTPQAIGKYLKDRQPSIEFIKKWKEVFGEDLMSNKIEPTVSRETSRFEMLSVREDVWEEIKRNNDTFRRALDSLLATVDKTMDNLSKARHSDN